MADLIIPLPDAAGYWHFTYVTTDPVDGRWYGGKRSTKNHPLSDPYRGSGNWVRAHPERKRLVREIVAFFPTSEAVYAAEATLVTLADVLDDPFCMNERDGGEGMSVEAARIRSDNPQWRKAQAAGSRKRSKTPEWREKNMKKVATPEWQEKNAAQRALLYADPKWREAATKRLNDIRTADPEWSAKMSAAGQLSAEFRRTASDEWHKKRLAKMRLVYASPKWKDAHAAGVQRLAKDPAWLEKVTATSRRLAKDPAWMAANAASFERMWASPEYRQNHATAMRRNGDNPEICAKKSASIKKLWEDPEYRARMTAAFRLRGAAKRTKMVNQSSAIETF
jgi:hypothetical protein